MNEKEIDLIFFNLNKDIKYFDWDAFKRIKIHIGVLEVFFKQQFQKENYEYISEDDMKEYFRKRGYDFVKREDLQYLIQLIEDEDLDYMDFVKRIKEELK